MPAIQPGWHDAPPGTSVWHCPECDTNSAASRWAVSEDGQRRTCPNPQCEWEYTAETAGRIGEADSEGLVPRETDEGRIVPPKLRG